MQTYNYELFSSPGKALDAAKQLLKREGSDDLTISDALRAVEISVLSNILREIMITK